MPGIYQKIYECKKKIAPIIKTRYSEYTSSMFANLGDVMSVIEPVLEELKLLVISPMSTSDGRQYLTTKIIDLDSFEDAETANNTIQTTVLLDKYMDKVSPHKVGAAISYARRYGICSLLNLITLDDDANSAEKEAINEESPISNKQITLIENYVIKLKYPTEKLIDYIGKITQGTANKVEQLNMKQAAIVIDGFRKLVDKGGKNETTR